MIMKPTKLDTKRLKETMMEMEVTKLTVVTCELRMTSKKSLKNAWEGFCIS